MKISTGGIGTVATSALASAGAGGFTKGVNRVGNKIPIGYSNFEGPDSDFNFIRTGTDPTGAGLFPGAKYQFNYDRNQVHDFISVEVDRTSGSGVNGPHTLRIVANTRGPQWGQTYPNVVTDAITFGNKSPNGEEHNVEFSFNIPAGKIWDLSFSVKANTATDSGITTAVICGNNTHFPLGTYYLYTTGPEIGHIGHPGLETISQADTWERKTMEIDLSLTTPQAGGHNNISGRPLAWTKNGAPEGGGPQHPYGDWNNSLLLSIAYTSGFNSGAISNSTYTSPSWNGVGISHDPGLDSTIAHPDASFALLNPGDATRVGLVFFINAASTQSIEYHLDDITFIEKS